MRKDAEGYLVSSYGIVGIVEVTPKEDKGVVQNSFYFPDNAQTFAGYEVVRLDKPATGLESFRARTPSGLEIRLTESPIEAFQDTRNRETMCHYVVMRGYAICVTNGDDGVNVNIAIAGTHDFVLGVQPGTDYVIYTPENAAFSFMESTRTVSTPEVDTLLVQAKELGANGLLDLLVKQGSWTSDELQAAISSSFE